MVKVSILGQMAKPTQDNLKIIRNTDLGYINGLMVNFTKVFGKMVNNMAKVSSQIHWEQAAKEDGNMVSKLNG